MGKKKNNKQDPYHEREARLYDQPVPSREFITETLRNADKPLSFPQLLKVLSIRSEDDKEGMRRRVKAMLRDGQLSDTKKGQLLPVDQASLVRGRVQGNKEGFGFLIPEEGGDDLFLSRFQMALVLPGDIVLARAFSGRSGKSEGEIVEIVERNTSTCVARYWDDKGTHFLEPVDKAIAQDFMLHEDCEHDAKPGDYVLVEMVHQPSKRAPGVANIIRILGDEQTPGIEIQLAAHTYDLPFEWSDEVLKEAEAIPESVSDSEREGRNDYRASPFVTIDGIDAKDFDDAVYCKPCDDGGWMLYVAIADVAHYVKPGSALDKEAFERGNSVYFPTLVIPMLPERLSNGICSLKPKVDRLAMVAEMRINEQGEVLSSSLHEGVIHSHARITYREAMDALNDDTRSHAMINELEQLRDVYDVLLKKRQERGAIEFELPAPSFSFDDRGKISGVGVTHRCDTHRMIEESMLAANVSVAKWLEKNEPEVLYRVHEGPNPEKLVNVRSFLSSFGLSLKGGEEPEPKAYGEVLHEIADRPEAHLVQVVLLRSLKQAIYTPDNAGHFGLAYDTYSHFTSPIRRYPDLLIHRAIKSLLRQEPKHYPYDEATLLSHGEHCSQTERRADYATRDAMDRLQCEFMEKHVGEDFKARIADVTRFGVFIECDDNYVKGLVHVTVLGKDFFEFEPEQYRLVGRKSGKVYRLGDGITVRLARVSVEDRQMDFVLA